MAISPLSSGGSPANAASNSGFNPSDFAHYEEISLESGDPVGQFYSVGVTLNTAALVTSGQMKADGSDLAVAWDSTGLGAWTEIDAHLRPVPGQTLAVSSATQVWFALADPSGVSAYPYSGRYRIYHGFPGALIQDRRRNGKLVYRFFDDFPGTAIDSSIWYVHPSYASAVTVSGGILRQNGFLSPGGIWQGPQIRVVSETALNVPTVDVTYSSPFAMECRFLTESLADEVRPVNYLQHMPPPGFPSDHDEYSTYVSSNGNLSIRLIEVSNGLGVATLVSSPTVIPAFTWHDMKSTVKLVVSSPGEERALHSLYLDGSPLGNSSGVPRGGWDATITSGTIALETTPGTIGDYDWVLTRAFTIHEPAVIADPAVFLTVTQPASGTRVDWIAPGDAISYDVIRGNVAFIVESAGALDLGPVTCIENDSIDTTTFPDHLDSSAPSVNQTYFYLLREKTSLTAGIYGHSTAGHKRVPSSGGCF